jgi:hypothetical protein
MHAWNWKANGAGSANTDGSISSTVSASATSGFSIVSYSGNGTQGANCWSWIRFCLDDNYFKNVEDTAEIWQCGINL